LSFVAIWLIADIGTGRREHRASARSYLEFLGLVSGGRPPGLPRERLVTGRVPQV